MIKQKQGIKTRIIKEKTKKVHVLRKALWYSVNIRRSSLFQNLFKEQDKWQVKYNQICDASDYACSWTPHYTWMLGWYLSEAIKYSPLHNII